MSAYGTDKQKGIPYNALAVKDEYLEEVREPRYSLTFNEDPDGIPVFNNAISYDAKLGRVFAIAHGATKPEITGEHPVRNLCLSICHRIPDKLNQKRVVELMREID